MDTLRGVDDREAVSVVGARSRGVNTGSLVDLRPRDQRREKTPDRSHLALDSVLSHRRRARCSSRSRCVSGSGHRVDHCRGEWPDGTDTLAKRPHERKSLQRRQAVAGGCSIRREARAKGRSCSREARRRQEAASKSLTTIIGNTRAGTKAVASRGLWSIVPYPERRNV